MADQDLDQTESATPHKLSEARKKGSVAKSQDFVSMAMLAAACIVLFANGHDMLAQTLRLQRQILVHAPSGQWVVGIAELDGTDVPGFARRGGACQLIPDWPGFQHASADA
jgi:hypothetical protein